MNQTSRPQPVDPTPTAFGDVTGLPTPHSVNTPGSLARVERRYHSGGARVDRHPFERKRRLDRSADAPGTTTDPILSP